MTDGKMYCPAGENYPTCVRTAYGTGAGTGKVFINSESGNKFLTVATQDSDQWGYKKASILWDAINTSAVNVAENYSIQFDFKGTYSTYYFGLMNNLFAGFFNYVNYGTNKQGGFLTGGILNLTAQKDEIWQQGRIYYNTLLNKAEPPIGCVNMLNGEWHKISIHYLTNGTHLQNTLVYDYDILCLNVSTNVLQSYTYPLFDYLYFLSYGSINASYDNIAVYEGLATPIPDYSDISDAILCPVDNCLFYENFNYEQGYNLQENNWNYYTQTTNFWDEKYMYYNLSISENKYIEKSFIAHDDKIIEGLITFKTNDFIIPDEYNTKFNGFEVSLECIDDGQAGTFTVKTFDFAVLKDVGFTSSENNSLVNIYTYENGYLKAKGTMEVKPNDFVHTKYIIDYDQQKIYFFVLQDYLSIYDYDRDNYIFSTDFNVPCNEIANLGVNYIDGGITNTTPYFMLDTIIFYGTPESGDYLVYDYFNESDRLNESEAIVEKDAGDIINNVAQTLGFKSDGSRILFWFVIIFIFSLAIAHTDLPPIAKGFAIPIIFIGMFIIGWKFGFIPNSLFIFLIFIIALIGAFVYQRLVNSGSTTG